MYVKNPEPRPGEVHPFEAWEELHAIADELERLPQRRGIMFPEPEGGRAAEHQ